MQMKVPEDLIKKALWFACSASSQTYERTAKSKEDPFFHLWRIFTGKLGELYFAYFLKEHIPEFNLEEYETNALSIFWGKVNVDSYDLKIKNYLIDIKTLPFKTHRYLIIPADQYINQPKDLYVCVRLVHDLKPDDIQNLFQINCVELYQLLTEKKFPVFDININIEICGYIEHSSKMWKYVKKDNICHEKECFRIDVKQLKSIDLFLRLFKTENGLL